MANQSRKRVKQPAPALAALADWKARNPVRVWLNARPRGSHRQLADALGVTKQAVYDWLAGKSEPPLRTFLRLEDLTGVTPRAWVAWQN